MPSRSLLYLLVGALGVVVIVLGYRLYEEARKPDGVEISIGQHGVSIEKN